jgi:hypothetical protein
VLDHATCVQTLRFARIERQIAGIQAQLDGAGAAHADVTALLRRKNELRTQLELARRGPRDGYNK